ncbi:hypothetical protein KR074_001864, partial [Drosophila pseudoananassae]
TTTETLSAMDYMTVQLRGENNAVVRFVISTVTPMRRLMDIYCKRLGLQRYEASFQYNGQNIKMDDTPVSLEMKDMDFIYVYTRQ